MSNDDRVDSHRDAGHASPAAARALLALSSPKHYQETILGDLEEEYYSVALPMYGLRRARRWYWSQVVRSFARLSGLHVRTRRLGRGIAGIVAGLGGFLGSMLGLAVVASFFVPSGRIVLSDLGPFGWLLVPTVTTACFVGTGYACERVAATHGVRLPSLAWLATALFLLTRYDDPVAFSVFMLAVAPGLPAAWFGASLARPQSKTGSLEV